MKRWAIAGPVLALALLSYFQFPGHTYLQSDTQIYLPILENLWDPGALNRDLIVYRPHVAFTFYDEIALALRKITGLGFREVLAVTQIVCRALGIWGVFLMATAAGLAHGPALLVTSVVSLGATINGPAVLTFEYEPVPRGFAVPLVLLGAGFAAQGRLLAANVAGAIAFLLHPPSVYPFWIVLGVLARRHLRVLLPLAGATLLLWIASRLQAGSSDFFARLDPLQEQLIRMRATYVWISVWGRQWLPHYVILYVLSLAAFFRLREAATRELRMLLIGLPLIGILSVPVSYICLEKLKWALMPQLQPIRALLFLTLIAGFSAAAAGCWAIRSGRYAEAALWLALAYSIPCNLRLTEAPPLHRALVVAVLAAGALRLRQISAVTALAAFFLIPIYGGVRNYPRLHSVELAQLAGWARSATGKDSVFLFPDAGTELYPGIFRAESVRAVYVDWKGGGQVNYFKALGEEWWKRWQKTMTGPLEPDRYRGLGIDYLVLKSRNRLTASNPVWQNAGFVVYDLTSLPPQASSP